MSAAHPADGGDLVVAEQRSSVLPASTRWNPASVSSTPRRRAPARQQGVDVRDRRDLRGGPAASRPRAPAPSARSVSSAPAIGSISSQPSVSSTATRVGTRSGNRPATVGCTRASARKCSQGALSHRSPASVATRATAEMLHIFTGSIGWVRRRPDLARTASIQASTRSNQPGRNHAGPGAGGVGRIQLDDRTGHDLGDRGVSDVARERPAGRRASIRVARRRAPSGRRAAWPSGRGRRRRPPASGPWRTRYSGPPGRRTTAGSPSRRRGPCRGEGGRRGGLGHGAERVTRVSPAATGSPRGWTACAGPTRRAGSRSSGRCR